VHRAVKTIAASVVSPEQCTKQARVASVSVLFLPYRQARGDMHVDTRHRPPTMRITCTYASTAGDKTADNDGKLKAVYSVKDVERVGFMAGMRE